MVGSRVTRLGRLIRERKGKVPETFSPTFSEDQASAESRGEFFRTNSLVNFVGDFSVDF